MLGLNGLTCFCCHLTSADFFKMNFFPKKNAFRNTIRVSNKIGPDQDGHSVGLDLGPNCKGCQQTTEFSASKERVNPSTAIHIKSRQLVFSNIPHHHQIFD